MISGLSGSAMRAWSSSGSPVSSGVSALRSEEIAAFPGVHRMIDQPAGALGVIPALMNEVFPAPDGPDDSEQIAAALRACATSARPRPRGRRSTRRRLR